MGLWLVDENSIGDMVASTARIRRNGKHRTEAQRGRGVGSQEFDRCEALTFCAVLRLTPRCHCGIFVHPAAILSVTLCDAFLLAGSRGDAKSSPRNFRPPSESPSVTSVTSVRCSPLRVVLARDSKVFTTALSSLIFQLDPEKASLNEEREPRCRGL